jgi:hypothetical protein
MPDSYNRYSLAELQAYILRNLASLRVQTVDPVTGQESGTTFLGENAQFSAQNLLIRINSSLTKTSLLINAENDKIFAKEVFYDAVPGVLLYPIPPDYMQGRGLWWKDASVPAPAPPDAYRLMSMQDTIDAPHDFGGQVNRPTYRRVGGHWQLNRDPKDFSQSINTSGIWVRYLRWNEFLVDPTDYISLPYAQVVQEIVVWDATMDCINSQDEMVDASGVAKTLAYWNQQLEILIRNEYRPPEIRLIGPAHHYLTFSGRR